MADLFNKVVKDPTMRMVRMGKDQGIYPYFKPLSETEGTEVVIDGKRLIMIGSNNYLGLTTHPKVRQAAIDAINRYGTSCTGSRFLNGTLEIHKELERRLARFMGKEAALIFGTGYQANLGALTALLGKDDIAIADKEIHASLVDALQMAGCRLKRYRHNDMEDLERVLKDVNAESPSAGKLIIVDGVYSMGGDLAPLPDIVALAKRYEARFFVDDAHGLGVMGEGGRGTHFHFNCVDDVDLVMGTFSKSFASLGGVIAGSREVIDYIQHHARSLIFSASMPPANVATVLACVDIVEADPSYVAQVHTQSAKVRTALRGMGYNCGESVTPIVPVFIGSEMNTVFAWKAFFEHGVYVNPVLPPGVPPNKSLLRTSYMASHTDEQIERVIQAFHTVGLATGLIEEPAAASA
ncbi:MAG: pyridoxal phosphate-dependent aminotransferase family protein [Thermoflexales bacterium]|nr:pyridoxal phosphate-dependent aminotransferase family protein [Thermoflexales bacterium]